MVGSRLLNAFDELNAVNTGVSIEVIIEVRPSNTSRESGGSQSMSAIGDLIKQLAPEQNVSSKS